MNPTRHILPALPNPIYTLRRLHPFLKKSIRFLPFDLIRIPIETTMQNALKAPFLEGDLNFLQGRWIQFHIIDFKTRWNVTLGTHGPILVASPVRADVTISGNLKDFIAMANSENDPDTLFFQRKILIEGDTEMSLMIKNTLFGSEKRRWTQKLIHALDFALSRLEPD